MKTARDLMTKNPFFLYANALVNESISFFLQHGIHSLPVLTLNNEILGMVSDEALVKASLRKLQKSGPTNSNILFDHRDLFQEAQAIQDRASVHEVITAMMRSPGRRVLVLNPLMKLVGVISPRDILRVLSGDKKDLDEVKGKVQDIEKRTKALEQKVVNVEGLTVFYRELFDASPLLMHSVDISRNIIMANRKIHDVLGYEQGELLGKSIFELYPEDAHADAESGLKNIQKFGFQESLKTTMLHKEGQCIEVDLVSSALKGANDKFLGTITAARTLDDSKSLLESLTKLYAPA